MKRYRIGDTLSDVEAYALADRKTETLAEVKDKTLYPDNSNVKTKALPDTLAATLANTSDSLGIVNGEVLKN